MSELPKPGEIDEHSGFELVWRSVARRTDHSLVRVPLSEEFFLRYYRRQLLSRPMIEFEFAPIADTHYWQLDGTIDTNIITNIGAIPWRNLAGHAGIPLSDRERDYLKDIKHISPSDDLHDIYRAEAYTFSISNVYRLLNSIWRPDKFESPPPPIRLERNGMEIVDGSRILPQKFPAESDMKRVVSLSVHREKPLQ